MFTNHTWHGVPYRSVSVSNLLWSEGRKATALQPAKEGAAWIAATIVSRGRLQGSWCMICAPARETSKCEGALLIFECDQRGSRALIIDHWSLHQQSCRWTSCSWLIMLQEYWCLTSMFSKWILTCTRKVLPITSNLGHSKLIFSSWSSVCVWSSSFHLWGLCSYLDKFPLRKWLV